MWRDAHVDENTPPERFLKPLDNLIIVLVSGNTYLFQMDMFDTGVRFPEILWANIVV